MQAEITIREIVHAGVLSCAPETPVSEAARRMVEAQCSSIVVESAGSIVGIWTEQDALGLDISNAELFQSAIAQFMSAPVKTLAIDTGIGEAALRFREEGVRHFLVIDAAGAPCGIISQSDIVINQGIEYFIALREISAVFNERHVVASGTQPIQEAVREMKRSRLDAVVVSCAERGYGILTERDVVRLISTGRSMGSVGDLASYPLVTLPITASLYHARKQFVDKRIRHLGVTDGDGELRGLITFADILASIEHDYVRHLREALRESEASLAVSTQHLRLAATAFECTFEGILVTDAANVIESVNPAFTRITGYTAAEVIGKTPSLLASGRHDAAFYQAMREALAQTGHWQGEICNRRKGGEVYVEWLTINAVKDKSGRVTNYVAVFTDFTTRKAAEDQMRFLAQHDALTGLPNRTLLHERLLRAIPHARRNGRKLAVIFLDLDGFKEINDNFGHHAGDQMLRVVAQRLTDAVRAEDTVARLGGDEFILVLEEIADTAAIPAVVVKIIESIGRPIIFDGKEMHIATSVGISLYPDDGVDADALVNNADAAMYRAKEMGSNAFRFYSGAAAG